jgi:prepilin-type N-terminal cleavage/methylation domain-containing protein
MPQPIDAHRGEAGFTLLETIVSLVILASGLMAFYAFLGTMFHSAVRLEAASTAFDRHANALEIARFLNPMEVPEGTFNLGTYRIQWTTELLKDVRQGSRYPVGSGLFKVGLYRITFQFPDDDAITPVAVEKVGYRRELTPLERMMSQQKQSDANR